MIQALTLIYFAIVRPKSFLENIFIYINAYMASHATPHWLSLLRDIQM